VPEPIDLYALDLDNLHHIQRQILARLYTVSSAAYSELKDPDLTGNSFNYHLRHVVSQGLVHQSGQDYNLTPRGRLLVDSVSLPSMKLKIRPVVGISLLITSPEHGTLLYRSKREPAQGMAGLPFGKLRLGDDHAATVKRMLIRRQLDPDSVRDVRPLGHANIRYYDRGELVSHRSAGVWRGTYDGSAIATKTEHGAGFWSENPSSEPHKLSEIDALLGWPTGQSIIEITGDLRG
jgi:hypothetical protein